MKRIVQNLFINFTSFTRFDSSYFIQFSFIKPYVYYKLHIFKYFLFSATKWYAMRT